MPFPQIHPTLPHLQRKRIDRQVMQRLNNRLPFLNPREILATGERPHLLRLAFALPTSPITDIELRLFPRAARTECAHAARFAKVPSDSLFEATVVAEFGGGGRNKDEVVAWADGATVKHACFMAGGAIAFVDAH